MVKKLESPVIGTIFSIFSDTGPQVIFNSTEDLISENQALNLSIRVLTLIGGDERTDIYGPLPIPSNEKFLCLAYPFQVESTFTSDEKLNEKPCIIFIIFKQEFKREMSRTHGLILSYLSKLTSEDFRREDNLKVEKMIDINKGISDLITMNPVRIYRVIGNKITEHSGDFYIRSDAYVIADLEKKTLFVIFDNHLSPVSKPQVGLIIDSMEEKRRGGFNKRIVDSPEEADRLIHFFGIKMDHKK